MSRSTCSAAIVVCLAFAHPARPGPEIHLRSVRLGSADALTPAALALLPPGPDLFAVAARQAVDGELHRRITALGMADLAYLPDRALAVWGAPSALMRLAEDPLVEAVFLIAPRWRIAPELGNLPASEPARVEILMVPQVGLEGTREALTALGVSVLGAGEGPRFGRINAELPARRSSGLLEAVASLPGVFSVSRRPVYRLLNDDSIWVGQAGMQAAGTTPIFDRGIRGEGQIVAVLDTGLDADMCYFHDPSGLPPANTGFGTAVDLGQRKVIAYDFLWSADDSADPGDWDDQGHGTHVAGSVAGDNFANPIAHDAGDGMAPAARLVIQDGGYRVDACGDIPALGCPMVSLTPYFDQAWQQGARIHTNSWGDQEDAMPQNNYTAGCLDSDDFMWTHPDFLLLFAAGNSGPNDNTVGSPSVAKNVISVGATQHGASADAMANFSSRGWAADGRIKPTLTCPGVAIRSARNDANNNSFNCSTASASGTSMASPTCAGLAALVRQYFSDGYYPSGRPQPADAFTPSAALLKAALINSARNMTGTTAMISRSQGFGRVTLADTLALPASARQLFIADERSAYPTGSTATRSYPVTVLGSAEPLKVTLVWTDFPSSALAARNLVNDLDLVVSGPTGTYLGNVFSAGSSTTGGSADRINVEEEVLIPAPGPGTWTIEVRAAAVPQGVQGFGLVATGDFLDPPGVVLVGASSGPDTLDASCTDGDGRPDNGETFRHSVLVRNPGESIATDVRTTLSSPSPYLSIVSANPAVLASIPPGATGSADFDLKVSGASCQTSASLTASTTSAENLVPETRTTSVVLEEDIVIGDVRLDFENGLIDSNGQTWSASAAFAVSSSRQNGGLQSLWAGVAPGSGHCDGSGSRDGASACAWLLSPPLTPQPGNLLELATWYQFEARSSGQYWDRGNVHVIDGATHTLLVPASGRGYDGGAGDFSSLCHLSGQDGWGGDTAGTSWATTTFDLSPWAAREIQIEINYNTDNGEICEGLYLDDVELGGIGRRACDGHFCAGSCAVAALPPLRRLAGAKTGGTAVAWTWQDPGPGAADYHLNSVASKLDLAGPDPASPHLSPRGRGMLECSSAGLACTDLDALDPLPPLRFYQVLAACGASGADEGAY